jgi:NitT/TauT family transport system substrate-binding protein
VAEKYTREKMFKNQLSSEDYRQAMENAPLTYDLTLREVQVSTDLMFKYGIAKMTKPPVAKDYVRLDLLEKAKKDWARSSAFDAGECSWKKQPRF